MVDLQFNTKLPLPLVGDLIHNISISKYQYNNLPGIWHRNIRYQA